MGTVLGTSDTLSQNFGASSQTQHQTRQLTLTRCFEVNTNLLQKTRDRTADLLRCTSDGSTTGTGLYHQHYQLRVA